MVKRSMATLLVLLLGCPGDVEIHDAAEPDVSKSDAPGQESSVPLHDGPSCPTLAELEGSYQGTFDGTLSGSVPATVSGTVSFTLVRQGTDEFVTITGGKLVGVAQGAIDYTADMGGTVKCDKIDAKITNGKVLTATFEGTMTGTWSSGAINDGTWIGQDTTATFQGTGSWKATRQ